MEPASSVLNSNEHRILDPNVAPTLVHLARSFWLTELVRNAQNLRDLNTTQLIVLLMFAMVLEIGAIGKTARAVT